MQYSLGSFEIDDELFEVRHAGQRISVAPRVFDTLLLLVTNSHRVITKSELRAKVWSGVIVTDDALNQAVRKVRRIVSPVASVQSVRGRGYRLVAKPNDAKGEVASSTDYRAFDSLKSRSLFVVLSE